MTHPNENFPLHLLSRQTKASGSGSQPSKADLFARWFTNKHENFAIRLIRSFLSFTPECIHRQGLSPLSNQNALTQQFFMRFMKEQMAIPEARFEQLQTFQQELLKQNKELRRKAIQKPRGSLQQAGSFNQSLQVRGDGQ
ncbi:hypothetical protein J1N35_008493 [Gossypium stocksii]|uniref:Uncharacterized protein n=1 Tax=Gossypium stocksii TaxID=47602 RepID=A0A9D3WAG3_9ROSI|nr:hypothetical protein J1N35_008493 [Gossypium stocksii]